MERSFQGQVERRRQGRAAAFDEVHGELEPGGLERKAQARGRRLGSGSKRAVEERDRAARFRRHGKAWQLGIQRGKAGGQRGNSLSESPAAPDRVPLQNFLKGAHTVFSYSIRAVTRASGRSSACAAATGTRP